MMSAEGRRAASRRIAEDFKVADAKLIAERESILATLDADDSIVDEVVIEDGGSSSSSNGIISEEDGSLRLRCHQR